MIAVGQARTKAEGGSAGRLAAGRRPDRGGRGVDKPAKKAGGGGLKGKSKKASASSANPIARGFKLIVLLGVMAAVGFALVLVVDVGASLAGRVPFFKDGRGDVTFADLFDKVSDRVFDRDVPEPKKTTPKTVKTAPTKTTSSTKPELKAPETTRAPEKAPSPEDYAKHTAPQKDPEVEQAKQRLDALLKNL